MNRIRLSWYLRAGEVEGKLGLVETSTRGGGGDEFLGGRWGELADKSGESLGVEAAIAEGDEEGEGVAIKARFQDVGHLEGQLQRLLRVPRCFRLHGSLTYELSSGLRTENRRLWRRLGAGGRLGSYPVILLN